MTKRPRAWIAGTLMLMLCISSCTHQTAKPPEPAALATSSAASPEPTPIATPVTPSATAVRSQSTPATAKIITRYAELTKLGTPEEITSEFSRDELVLNAEYLFEHFVTYENLELYSDRPFDLDKGREILKEVRHRLEASPVYDPQKPHLGFVCNDAWRSEFFLQGKDKYGGLSYCSIAPRVFFASARIDDDVVLSPRGRPIAAPRTLTYYVTHEFAHAVVRYAAADVSELPTWLFEGYPDFVALGPNFTYEKALDAYKNRDPRVNGTMAGDYMMYDVLTAYYLDHKKVRVRDLLADPPSYERAKEEEFEGRDIASKP